MERWRENRAAARRAGDRSARGGAAPRAAASTRSPRSPARACGSARPTRSASGWTRPSTARRSPAARAAIRDALDGEGSGARDAAAGGAPRGALAGPPRPALRDDRGAAGGSRGGARGRRRSRSGELAEGVDHDPRARSPALEERLRRSTACERRYGDDEAAVIAHGERAAAEVERLAGWTTSGRRARPTTRGCSSGSRRPRADCRPRGRPRRRASAARRGRSCGARFPRRGVRGRARPAAGRTDEPRSRSTATRSPSMRRGSTRSCSGSPRTPVSLLGRSRRSPRAAS